MTQEEKQLLTKVLCELFPYGVMCRMSGVGFETIEEDKLTAIGLFQFVEEGLECIPYLRSMSSMTENEHNDWCQYYKNAEMEELNKSGDYFKAAMSGDNAKYDWLNAHYFDYRGLIPKGLALKAKENMYK